MKERDLKKDDSLQASDTGFSGHISLGIKHANQVWKLSQRSPLTQRVLLTTLCLHFFLLSLFVAQTLPPLLPLKEMCGISLNWSYWQQHQLFSILDLKSRNSLWSDLRNIQLNRIELAIKSSCWIHISSAACVQTTCYILWSVFWAAVKVSGSGSLFLIGSAVYEPHDGADVILCI